MSTPFLSRALAKKALSPLLTLILLMSPVVYGFWIAPSGFSETHQKITEEAMEVFEADLGGVASISFESDAVDRVADTNRGVDGGMEGNTASAHCDDEEISECQARIIARMNLVIDRMGSDWSKQDMQVIWREMGKGLHTLQDFYAHSNWVEMNGNDPNEALLEENFEYTVSSGSLCATDPTGQSEKQLTSGYYGAVENINAFNGPYFLRSVSKCVHGNKLNRTPAYLRVSALSDKVTLPEGDEDAGLNKDSSYRRGHDLARTAAVRATLDYFKKIVTGIIEDHEKNQTGQGYCAVAKLLGVSLPDELSQNELDMLPRVEVEVKNTAFLILSSQDNIAGEVKAKGAIKWELDQDFEAAHGNVTIDEKTGKFSYQLTDRSATQDQFTVIITGCTGEEVAQIITITIDHTQELTDTYVEWLVDGRTVRAGPDALLSIFSVNCAFPDDGGECWLHIRGARGDSSLVDLNHIDISIRPLLVQSGKATFFTTLNESGSIFDIFDGDFAVADVAVFNPGLPAVEGVPNNVYVMATYDYNGKNGTSSAGDLSFELYHVPGPDDPNTPLEDNGVQMIKGTFTFNVTDGLWYIPAVPFNLGDKSVTGSFQFIISKCLGGREGSKPLCQVDWEHP